VRVKNHDIPRGETWPLRRTAFSCVIAICLAIFDALIRWIVRYNGAYPERSIIVDDDQTPPAVWATRYQDIEA